MCSLSKKQSISSNETIESAQVDTDGKYGLFLHEHLANLHTENTHTNFKHSTR